MESTEAARLGEACTDAGEARAPNVITTRQHALPETLGFLAGPFYAVAAMLLLLPIIDFMGTVAPAQWSEIRWRFGMVGVLSGFTLTPLYGAVLGMALAAMLEHRLMLRLMAVVNAVLSVTMLAALTLFTLDSLQLRGEVGPQGIRAFDLIIVRTAGKIFLAAIVLAWLARASLKSMRKARTDEVWSPGDAVPLVNAEVVSEGGGLDVLTSTVSVRPDMLVSSSAVPEVTPMRISQAVMLVSADTAPSAAASTSVPRTGVSRDILVRGEAADGEGKVQRSSGVTPSMLIVGGGPVEEDDPADPPRATPGKQ